MGSFDITELGTEYCPECGRQYWVRYQSLPFKDKDDARCECGHVFRKWNETGMYMYQEIGENRE